MRPLLPRFAPSVEGYRVLPGTGDLCFTATDGCDQTLYKLSLKDGAQPLRYELPVSYVQGYSVSHDGRTAVFFGQTATRARDLYRRKCSGQRKRL